MKKARAELYGMMARLGGVGDREDDGARRHMHSGGGSEKEARRRSERGEGIGTGASGGGRASGRGEGSPRRRGFILSRRGRRGGWTATDALYPARSEE